MAQVETEQIYSSTGSLGVSRRQYDRLYVNGTHAAADFGELAVNYGRLVGITERREKLSRAVYRGVVVNNVFKQIMDSSLADHVAVALPLDEFGQSGDWLVYMEKNAPERSPIHSPSDMMTVTNYYDHKPVSLENRRANLQRTNLGVASSFTSNQIDDVHALWGQTFGWKRDEVIALQHRLEATPKNPQERSLWFSGVVDGGRIVAAAMAEKLVLPATNGNVSLIESTEWRVQDGYDGLGIMATNLGILNQRILEDTGESDSTIVIAECNFTSRSDFAGDRAGFRVPERRVGGYLIPQLLIQNVNVQDGHTYEGKLRDFTFMYLPADIIATQYKKQREEVLVFSGGK